MLASINVLFVLLDVKTVQEVLKIVQRAQLIESYLEIHVYVLMAIMRILPPLLVNPVLITV